MIFSKMNGPSFKFKVKDEKLIIKAKLSSTDEISDRELSVLSSGFVTGLFRAEKIKPRVLEYSGANGVSLSEHLKKTITRYDFFNMMVQIVECTKSVNRNKLFLDKLMLDLRYVYINENTKEIHFIYLPVESNHVCADVLGFMDAIVYSAKGKDDTDYISKYHNFIRSLNAYDADAIEEKIASMDQQAAMYIRKMKQISNGAITDHIGDVEKEPVDSEKPYSPWPEEDDGGGTVVLKHPEEDDEFGEETAVLSPDMDEDEGTTVLNDADDNYIQVHYPSLTRSSTGETISINKPVFRLGKERSYVDYFVSGNHSVSRSHADIITRGSRYYVLDHNATNHTYIDGMMLAPQKETEIFDGSNLRLANEEFIFHK